MLHDMAGLEFIDVINTRMLKKESITSFALIAHTIIEGKIHYLVGRVRDTIPFKEFVRGNMRGEDLHEIIRYISHMSLEEKFRVLYEDFQSLVDDVIVNHASRAYRGALENREEFEKSRIRLQGILQDNSIGLKETPWIFPKGRKQEPELDVECALREFEEETHIPASIVSIYDEIEPLEEIYTGLDGRLYRTVYFVGFIDSQEFSAASREIRSKFIVTENRTTLSEEIAKIKWFKYSEASSKLDSAKQYVLRLVNTFLIFHLGRRRPERRHSLG